MDILTCTDKKFVIPTGVMIYSVCKNNQSETLNFHVIIDNSVTEDLKNEILEETSRFSNVSLVFHKIDISNIRASLVVKNSAFPVSIYYRLLMTELLPEDIDKILYLDSDIVVCHNLRELWLFNIQDRPLAAVINQSDGGKSYKRLGLPSDKDYFNSGVMLVNLKYWRNNQCSKKLINYVQENPKVLVFPDQDALNYVFQDSKLLLPIKYNVQEKFFRANLSSFNKKFEKEISSAIYDPYILHYTGAKPWFTKCSHPLKSIYYQYKNETHWKNNMLMENRYRSNRKSFKKRIKNILDIMLGRSKPSPVYIEINSK